MKIPLTTFAIFAFLSFLPSIALSQYYQYVDADIKFIKNTLELVGNKTSLTELTSENSQVILNGNHVRGLEVSTEASTIYFKEDLWHETPRSKGCYLWPAGASF